MERSGWKQIIGRLSNVGRKSTQAKDVADVSFRRRRGWAVFIVLGVALCMVATLAGSLSSRNALGMSRPPDVNLLYDTGDGGSAPHLENSRMREPATDGAGASQAEQPTQQQWDRMIIRTGTLQLRVKDVAVTLEEVRTLAGGHGGYIAQSDSRQEGDYTVATITIQVPAREFDNAVSKLRKLGVKVLSENISSSDVTEEYTDLQSQLRNLQATETRMLALQAKAEKLEDILSIDRELRQIQGDIERIQGRVNFLSKRSEMSTITITLYPEAIAVEPMQQTANAWDPLETIENAWNASLELLSGVADALITVAVFMWWAVPLLLLAFLLWIRPRKKTSTPVAPAGDAS